MDTEPDKPPTVSMEELRSDAPAEPPTRSLLDSLTEPVEPARKGDSGKTSDDYGDTATHASETPEKAAKTPRVGLLGLLAEREKRKAAEARAHQVKTVRTETVTETRITGNQSLSKSDTRGSSTKQDAHKSSTDRKDNRDTKRADSSADKSSRDLKKADTGSARDHRNAGAKSTKGHDTKRAEQVGGARPQAGPTPGRRDTAARSSRPADSSTGKSPRKDSQGTRGSRPADSPPPGSKGGGGAVKLGKSKFPNQDKEGVTPADLPESRPKMSESRGTAATKAAAVPRLPTQSSREAGYRDGNRAARGAGHVQAYGDGARDGWKAGRESTGAQREELNRRRDAAAQPENKEAEGMTTPTDTAPKPVTVTGVDKSGVTLGDGARPSMTRGEVRSLRSFQLRLEEQEQFLSRKADVARQIAAAAAQLHHEAVQMQESVKAVKGGEKLNGALARLIESSQGRVTAAEEVHTKALRAAEKAKTVRTNADTRYAPIYQAVVDSDETAPAEFTFYRDGGITRG